MLPLAGSARPAGPEGPPRRRLGEAAERPGENVEWLGHRHNACC